MNFIDSPSLFAPLTAWEAWAKRLQTMNATDLSVISEKKRAAEVIALLRTPEAVSDELIPD